MENKKNLEEQINIWKLSGLSKAEFCRKNGIAYTTFRDWVRKYNHKEIDWKKIEIQEETKSIFELKVDGNGKIEIVLRILF